MRPFLPLENGSIEALYRAARAAAEISQVHVLEQVVGRVAQGGSWAHAELLGDDVPPVVERLVGRSRVGLDPEPMAGVLDRAGEPCKRCGTTSNHAVTFASGFGPVGVGVAVERI